MGSLYIVGPKKTLISSFRKPKQRHAKRRDNTEPVTPFPNENSSLVILVGVVQVDVLYQTHDILS
uniref:Uncharacterized protein n=1 Tax=Solanum tuberosum TaxID=4113 RepID=M1CW23_SOLTU